MHRLALLLGHVQQVALVVVQIAVEGADATAFLNSVTSNDVAKLTPGKVQYSCLPNATGGIVDDLLVYCVNDTKYMLVVNASNMAKDWAWLQQFAGNFDVHMTDVSEDTALLAVQGPLAAQALQSLTDLDLGAMTYYTFGIGSFAGVSNVVVSATGYTGATGSTGATGYTGATGATGETGGTVIVVPPNR